MAILMGVAMPTDGTILDFVNMVATMTPKPDRIMLEMSELDELKRLLDKEGIKYTHLDMPHSPRHWQGISYAGLRVIGHTASGAHQTIYDQSRAMH